MAKLTHPTATSLSVGGEEIKANKDGIFIVLDKHVPILQEHGFQLVSVPEKPQEAPAK